MIDGRKIHTHIVSCSNEYNWGPKIVAKWRCDDCGDNFVKRGDFCMIDSCIWEEKLGLSWTDNLCIPCIERRLGRKLRPRDFRPGQPIVKGYPFSPILQQRSGYFQMMLGIDELERQKFRRRRKRKRAA
jgi:hypothetical protein